MLEKVEEAVGGEGMKSLHDKLKKMQVRALLLHFIRILPRRSGLRQLETNEGMTRYSCSQTKVVGRAKELEDKKERREGLREEQEQLENEMKRCAPILHI